MMNVLRIQMEGVVTSFRYPHFPHGMQPSYEMPPPATIYGHVCSALGEWVDPTSFCFSLHFTHQARFWDYEHIHLFGSEPKLSPFERELLFAPRMTLYINRPDWYQAFRSPHYVVTLGRSQDLMCYRAVDVVELHSAEKSYLENTYLLMHEARPLRHRQAVMMPRYLNADRVADWAMYAQITKVQVWDQPAWIDPETEPWRGLYRAVLWNSFAEVRPEANGSAQSDSSAAG